MKAREYAADVLLADGGLIHIRAIRPDDKRRLLEGFRRLSERSVYYRFFSLKRDLSAAELAYLTEVDFVQHVALAATVRPALPIHDLEFGFEEEPGASDRTGLEEIVGVARYVRRGADRAEVAIAVADDHQQRGVGSVLLQHLVAIARAAGITTIEAEVLAENASLHQVFLARNGFQPTFTPAGETVHLCFSIL
ncbi:MAG: GNAT family N-acetyltransferase [Chloroflexota bacterium]